MQETLTFPTLGSPPRFTFPELIHDRHETCFSELSSSTSTPFVSAPSSPSRMKGFYFSTPTSPTWNQRQPQSGYIPYWAQQQEDSSCQSINWSHRRQNSHDSLEAHGYGDSSRAPKSPPAEHYASPKAQLEKGPHRAQQPLQIDPFGSSRRYQTCTQTGTSHTLIDDDASPTALKRLQVQDLDVSYSRKGFFASAVPFSWEEKPGTPKARSVASDGDDDASSVMLSGSSDFEFSARFAELEEPPMSPTPISSTLNRFKQHVAVSYGSPSPTYKSALIQSEAASDEQIWPLRPPPRLNNPVLPMKQLIKDDASEHKLSYGLLSSLSAPQSPRSPRKFDIRGVFCGISSPADAVFDPFLVAMEKTMGEDRDSAFASEMRKTAKSEAASRGAPHHRRSQSSSPLRVFHWDDHSAKSNSSSNGSTSLDDMKSKHPIQREIDARHNAVATPKGLKRWSFRGFLHRKSESGGESARHSNTSSSLRSSGRESNMSSTSRRESCSSSAMGEVAMDMSNYGDDMNAIRGKGTSLPVSNPMLPSMPSTPSILSPSSSKNSNKGKLNARHKANHKGPYALHYGMQRAHTEDLSKKTFLPYKQGLLGCLGLSSKSYRAMATLSKPLQSVS